MDGMPPSTVDGAVNKKPKKGRKKKKKDAAGGAENGLEMANMGMGGDAQ